MSTQPQVEIELHSQAACIVTLRGEHDPSTIDEIGAVLNLASVYRYVLVDLTECSFVDSTVLHSLLRASERARELGGALELVAVPSKKNNIRRILEITRFDALLRVHPDRPRGVAALDKTSDPRTARAPARPIRRTDGEPPSGSGAWVTNAQRPESPEPEDSDPH